MKFDARIGTLRAEMDIERNLRRAWDQLRGKKPQLQDFLEEVTISGLRGINELRVPFPYPVSVFSGPNGCGKSSVLFSLACAYQVPGRGPRDFAPSAFFPDFRPANEDSQDPHREVSLDYSYLDGGRRLQMRWSRREKGWSRSFLGRPGAKQPKRQLFIRTLANLTNPSEVRSVLQLSRHQLDRRDLDASLLVFAHRILPYRYDRLTQLSKPKGKEVLFASRGVGAFAIQYSEFHMSSGERAILRLSRDLAQLRGALVLIDEVETGLHPYTQQQLMLEFHRWALTNDLQIVVTTHSPVILECVPEEGRIFLERTNGAVERRPPYRDIVQRALYGRAQDRLSIVCEDEAAEGLILGLFDCLNARLQLTPSDIEIGRDSGKTEFKHQLTALGRFNLLDSFIFVLDGDAVEEAEDLRAQARKQFQRDATVIVLPGKVSPEEWAWSRLTVWEEEQLGAVFDLESRALRREIQRIDQLFAGVSEKPGERAKGRIESLREFLNRDLRGLFRSIARNEADHGDLKEVTLALEEAVRSWRDRSLL
jgi:predicted ATPase